MESQLDILSKVMISLKEDQTVAMDNIQALLNNRDKETNLISKLKEEYFKLGKIENAMVQNEHFMVQIAQATIKQPEQPKEEPKQDAGIGSSGDIGPKPPSDK